MSTIDMLADRFVSQLPLEKIKNEAEYLVDEYGDEFMDGSWVEVNITDILDGPIFNVKAQFGEAGMDSFKYFVQTALPDGYSLRVENNEVYIMVQL